MRAFLTHFNTLGFARAISVAKIAHLRCCVILWAGLVLGLYLYFEGFKLPVSE